MQQLLRSRMEDSFAAPGGAHFLESLLTEGRSCVVEVINETTQTMRRVFHAALHGVFVREPAALVLPDSRDVFGMQNRPRGIGVGCEGVVRYALGETLVELHFDNPFVGRNFAGAQFSGKSTLEYSCDAHAEEGDARVRVRFVIRRRIEGNI
jgi:hypothetical protein